MGQDLSRCPKCNHFWTSHSVEVSGLVRRAFCYTVGCDCQMEQPKEQKALPAGATA